LTEVCLQRTPDNLYPNENALNPASGWDCTNFLQYSFGRGGTDQNVESANIYHETDSPAQHPFLSQIWNGTCDEGQLTRGGLDDSVIHGKVYRLTSVGCVCEAHHGKDFWGVYHDKLHFLTEVDEDQLYVRTSTETRTFQVAGGMLYGMDKRMAAKTFKVYTQPSVVRSFLLLPSSVEADHETSDRLLGSELRLSCGRRSSQRIPICACMDRPPPGKLRSPDASRPDVGDAGPLRLEQLVYVANHVIGGSLTASLDDHYFDTFTSRTCNAHSLPCNTTGACVSQADADRVFALGDFEYKYTHL
jgi:hypothetical protein